MIPRSGCLVEYTERFKKSLWGGMRGWRLFLLDIKIPKMHAMVLAKQPDYDLEVC